MRLVISRDSFKLHRIPGDRDFSYLHDPPVVRWHRGYRSLTVCWSEAVEIGLELDHCGVRVSDAEVRDAVAAALKEDPANGPAWVATYGDPRAVSELERALDAHQPHCARAMRDYLEVLGLGTAIELLGGTVTEPHRRKIAEYAARHDAEWIDGGVASRAMLAEVAPLATLEPDGTPAAPGRPRTLH